VQQSFLRNADKYYIYFIDNLLMFPAVKEFIKSVNSWLSYHQKSDTTFLLRHSVCVAVKVVWAGEEIWLVLMEYLACSNTVSFSHRRH